MPTPARVSYQAVRGYVDHATRKSSVRFNVSSAAWAAYGTDVTAGDISDMFSALDELSLDVPILGRAAKYFDEPGLTVSIPTDENAVNSAKLLALFQDTVTGKKFSMQIPARNAAHYTSIRGLVDINLSTRTSQISDFITSVIAAVLSEDGNAVAVYEIRVIGKGTAA